MTPEQLQTLKTEITTDPLARGYSGMGDVAVAESLNERTRQADRDSLTAIEIVSGVDKTEFTALVAADKTYFNLFVQAGGVNLNEVTKPQLGALFPVGSATRTALVALLKRTGSRAEELAIGSVTPSDVADAKRL